MDIAGPEHGNQPLWRIHICLLIINFFENIVNIKQAAKNVYYKIGRYLYAIDDP